MHGLPARCRTIRQYSRSNGSGTACSEHWRHQPKRTTVTCCRQQRRGRRWSTRVITRRDDYPKRRVQSLVKQTEGTHHPSALPEVARRRWRAPSRCSHRWLCRRCLHADSRVVDWRYKQWRRTDRPLVARVVYRKEAAQHCRPAQWRSAVGGVQGSVDAVGADCRGWFARLGWTYGRCERPTAHRWRDRGQPGMCPSVIDLRLPWLAGQGEISNADLPVVDGPCDGA